MEACKTGARSPQAAMCLAGCSLCSRWGAYATTLGLNQGMKWEERLLAKPLKTLVLSGKPASAALTAGCQVLDRLLPQRVQPLGGVGVQAVAQAQAAPIPAAPGVHIPRAGQHDGMPRPRCHLRTQKASGACPLLPVPLPPVLLLGGFWWVSAPTPWPCAHSEGPGGLGFVSPSVVCGVFLFPTLYVGRGL